MKNYLVKFRNHTKDCVESHIVEGMNSVTAIFFTKLQYNVSYNDIIYVEELPAEKASKSDEDNIDDDCIS